MTASYGKGRVVCAIVFVLLIFYICFKIYKREIPLPCTCEGNKDSTKCYETNIQMSARDPERDVRIAIPQTSQQGDIDLITYGEMGQAIKNLPVGLRKRLRDLSYCTSATKPLRLDVPNFKITPRQFSSAEMTQIESCSKMNLHRTHKQSWDTFLKPNVQTMRWTNHTYLNGNSKVIEIGGNTGLFSDNLQKLFKPGRYYILEPIEKYSDVLQEKYKNLNNIVVCGFGIGKEDRTDTVKLAGIATSKFLGTNAPKESLVPLRQVNATNFLLQMIFKYPEIDLLTINCEGCEYDILDTVLDSTLVNQFKHIQISFHHFGQLGNTLKRWCEYQELLKRTHRMVYQYKLFWESWTRKDLAK